MIYTYDGTFEGFLTVIFHIYEKRQVPVEIIRNTGFTNKILFDPVVSVETDTDLSDRVYKGLQKKLTPNAINDLYKSLNTESRDVEMTLYHYIRHTFSSRYNIEADLKNEAVMRVRQLAKLMDREIHTAHSSVQFSLTRDGIYAAGIMPNFDVLPFIGSHFQRRYPNQHWLIYDARRDYGIYYDLRSIGQVKINDLQPIDDHQMEKNNLSVKEPQLWNNYFSAVKDKEYKDIKLNLEHIDRRYWKFLMEKE